MAPKVKTYSSPEEKEAREEAASKAKSDKAKRKRRAWFWPTVGGAVVGGIASAMAIRAWDKHVLGRKDAGGDAPAPPVQSNPVAAAVPFAPLLPMIPMSVGYPAPPPVPPPPAVSNPVHDDADDVEEDEDIAGELERRWEDEGWDD